MLRQSVGDRIVTFGNLLRYIGGKRSSVAAYFLDTFTGTNGTLINARAPDSDPVGGGWVGYTANNHDIQSNKATYQGDGGLFTPMAVNFTGANATVTAVLNAGSGSQGIVARLQDASNYWLFLYTASVGAQIFERNGGTFTLRASTAGTHTPGVNVAATVVVSGTSLSVTFVDANTYTASYTSSFLQAQTRYGIRSGAAGNTVDTFRIDPL